MEKVHLYHHNGVVWLSTRRGKLDYANQPMLEPLGYPSISESLNPDLSPFCVKLKKHILLFYLEQTVCECLLNLTLQQLRKYILYSFLTQNYTQLTNHISNWFLSSENIKKHLISVLEKRSSEERVTSISYKLLNQNFIKILKMGKSFPFIHRLGFTKPLFSKGA